MSSCGIDFHAWSGIAAARRPLPHLRLGFVTLYASRQPVIGLLDELLARVDALHQSARQAMRRRGERP